MGEGGGGRGEGDGKLNQSDLLALVQVSLCLLWRFLKLQEIYNNCFF